MPAGSWGRRGVKAAPTVVVANVPKTCGVGLVSAMTIADHVVLTDDELLVNGRQVMQRWEEPLMKAMAEAITPADRVLEIGWGLGISAGHLLPRCQHYICIESIPEVARRGWNLLRKHWPYKVCMHEGDWREVLVADKLLHGLLPEFSDASFDAILFDAYEHEYREPGQQPDPPGYSWDMSAEFFPTAHRLLKPGGRFTYWSGEIETFTPEHLAALLDIGFEVTLSMCRGLQPPPDCEYWQHDRMVVPVCVKK